MTTKPRDLASVFEKLELWAGWLASHWQDLTEEQRTLMLAKQEQLDQKLRKLGRFSGLSLT